MVGYHHSLDYDRLGRGGQISRRLLVRTSRTRFSRVQENTWCFTVLEEISGQGEIQKRSFKDKTLITVERCQNKSDIESLSHLVSTYED